MRTTAISLRFAIASIACTAYLAARADTCVFLYSNGSWDVASNWDCGEVPGAGDNAVIPSGSTVTRDTAPVCRAVEVYGTLVVAGARYAVRDFDRGESDGESPIINGTFGEGDLEFAVVAGENMNGRTLGDGGSPPGYEFIRITETPGIEWSPRLNDAGDVVFVQRFGDRLEDYTDEIMLYRDGEITRITDDDFPDRYPIITNDGTIYWSKAMGPDGLYGPTLEIMRWKEGNAEQLTDNSLDDYAPVANDQGAYAWFMFTDDGCENSNSICYLWDGASIVQLTDNTSSKQTRAINNRNDVALTDYDFCPEQWVGNILVYWDGELERLTDQELQQQSPSINNHRTIMWGRWEDGRHIDVLDNGKRYELIDGTAPKINDHGDVFFHRSNPESDDYTTWGYLRGEFYKLPPDNLWNANGDINERTDLVWMNKGYPEYDIVMLKRLPFGDMNCDKSVNFADIDGFVAALIGKDTFLETEPDCDWWLADMNDDRSIDFNDIDPFVTCLVDGGCERK